MKLTHSLLPLITLSFLSFLTSLAAANDNLAPRLDITLDRSTMWNPLPDREVGDAVQGPDGRIWLYTTWRIAPNAMSSNRSHEDFQAILRREFNEKMPQVPARAILFEKGGGRVWFETIHRSPHAIVSYDGSTFIERTISPAAATYANGHAFFLAPPKTIHIHDSATRQWSTHEIPPSLPGRVSDDQSYKFFTDPDGKGMTGVPLSPANVLIRWRDNKWTQFTLPFPAGRNKIDHAAPRNDGIWLFSHATGLYFFSYEKATHQPTPQIDNIRIKYIYTLLTLSDGSTLFATNPTALFLQGPNNNIRNLGHPQLANQTILPLAENLLWFQGSYNDRSSLLDLTTNRIIHTIQLWDLAAIHAATPDGFLFLRKHFNFYAYHPEGKDHRAIRQPSHTTTALPGHILTGDGTYWFSQQQEPRDGNPGPFTASRFDGQKIQTHHKSPTPFFTPTNAILGHDGFIIPIQNTHTLISPRTSLSANTLEDLITQHPTEVALTFTGTRPVSNTPTTHIQADANANIWLLQNRQLKVYSDRKWLDATATLTNAGSHEGKASMLLPLGKSQKILAINDRLKDQSKSIFILSIHDKQVKIEPLNESYANLGHLTPNAIYSPLGEPWINIIKNDRLSSCRFNDTGSAQTLENHIIAAADENSSMLLWDGQSSSLKLLHNNTITDPPSPIRLKSHEKVTFIAPGTICLYSDLGIQFIPLNSTADPITLHFDTLSKPNTITYSPLGFATITTNNKPPSPNLYFFPLK